MIRFKKTLSFKSVAIGFVLAVIASQLFVAYQANSLLIDTWESTGQIMMIKPGKAPEMIDADLRMNIYRAKLRLKEHTFNVLLDVGGEDESLLKAMDYGVDPGTCEKTWQWTYHGRRVNNYDRKVMEFYNAAVRRFIPGHDDYYDFSPREYLKFEYGRFTRTACSENLFTRYSRDEAFWITKHPNGTYLIAAMEAQNNHSLIYRVVNFFRIRR